jgi:hypothetical protein
VNTPGESRKSARHAHEAAILIEHTSGVAYYHGKMRNYSRMGMYFESNMAHKPGTTIIFGIENSPYETCPGVYRAEVKWSRKLTQESSIYYYGAGVEYALPEQTLRFGQGAGTPRTPEAPLRPGAPAVPARSREREAVATVDSDSPTPDPKALPSTQGDRNGRQHPRRNYAKPILYASQDRFYEGRIKDISKSGVFIETADPLYVGQTLTLAIPSAKQNRGLKLRGEIVRIGPHGLGVKFKRIKKTSY